MKSTRGNGAFGLRATVVDAVAVARGADRAAAHARAGARGAPAFAAAADARGLLQHQHERVRRHHAVGAPGAHPQGGLQIFRVTEAPEAIVAPCEYLLALLFAADVRGIFDVLNEYGLMLSNMQSLLLMQRLITW